MQHLSTSVQNGYQAIRTVKHGYLHHNKPLNIQKQSTTVPMKHFSANGLTLRHITSSESPHVTLHKKT